MEMFNLKIKKKLMAFIVRLQNILAKNKTNLSHFHYKQFASLLGRLQLQLFKTMEDQLVIYRYHHHHHHYQQLWHFISKITDQ